MHVVCRYNSISYWQKPGTNELAYPSVSVVAAARAVHIGCHRHYPSGAGWRCIRVREYIYIHPGPWRYGAVEIPLPPGTASFRVTWELRKLTH